MKRRQVMRYAGAGFIAAIATGLTSGFERSQAQTTNSLTVQWLGHTCFLFTGNGKRILVNPFKTQGCTANYRAPKVAADLVLVSSLLLDEGSVRDLPGNPKILYEPGAYDVDGIKIQGISIDHDRVGGRRFGTNVAWRWTQGGINILHLGGAAAQIGVEEKILMGTPDLLLVPVGGSAKAYNPQEAFQAVQTLSPKMIIPTHYRTQAADADNCEIVGVDEFLKLTDNNSVRRINNDAIRIEPQNLPQSGSIVRVLSYKF